jgi:hypothetical protein
MAQPRRFPPPWSAEELDACFVVIDSAVMIMLLRLPQFPNNQQR